MLSGTLRDQITVYALTTGTASANERIRTYTKAFNDRAAISFTSGDPQFSTNTETIGKVNKFKVRFALGRYVETMVIFWRGDWYTIDSIEADSRRTYLYITGTRAMPGIIKLYVAPVIVPEPLT